MAQHEEKKEKLLFRTKESYCQEQERIEKIKDECRSIIKTLPKKETSFKIEE